jgi:pimeloyl-ACP methyl ester carboxylesterase
VALEMARWLQPEAVILIGSCRSYRAVPPVLRMLAPLAGLLKPARYKTLAPAGLGLWLLGEKVCEEDGRLLHQMLVDAEPAFFKWAAQAIVKWRYEGGVDAPIHHIHGDRDRLLRTKVVREYVDVMVEDAGHLINFTHADQVNAFLRESISNCMR